MRYAFVRGDERVPDDGAKEASSRLSSEIHLNMFEHHVDQELCVPMGDCVHGDKPLETRTGGGRLAKQERPLASGPRVR